MFDVKKNTRRQQTVVRIEKTADKDSRHKTVVNIPLYFLLNIYRYDYK